MLLTAFSRSMQICLVPATLFSNLGLYQPMTVCIEPSSDHSCSC